MTITGLWFTAVVAAAAVTGAAGPPVREAPAVAGGPGAPRVTGAARVGGPARVTAAARAAPRTLRTGDPPGTVRPAGDPSGGGAGCAGARCWPVAGQGLRGRPRVLRGFEPPATPWGAGHRGVDLRAGPGTAVRAVAAGRVAFAGDVGGTPVLVIALPGRLRVTYEPVRATAPVGAAVDAGEDVGVVTGVLPHCRTGPCLHWGLLRDGVYLDPLTLLPPALRRSGPSRLLPVRSGVTG